MARCAEVSRKTKETDITISINLDGTGNAKIDYPLGFMTHMLNTFARHGLFDIEISASGDLETDQHHLVEDTGIVLGQCFARALADKRGICRSGSCLFPMDETLARAVVDLSGRPYLFFDAQLSPSPLVSQVSDILSVDTLSDDKMSANAGVCYFQTDTIEDFWQGFSNAAGCNLHLEILRGRSDHHKIEALFKAAARSFRAACELDARAKDAIPSTKGSLELPCLAERSI